MLARCRCSHSSVILLESRARVIAGGRGATVRWGMMRWSMRSIIFQRFRKSRRRCFRVETPITHVISTRGRKKITLGEVCLLCNFHCVDANSLRS